MLRYLVSSFNGLNVTAEEGRGMRSIRRKWRDSDKVARSDQMPEGVGITRDESGTRRDFPGPARHYRSLAFSLCTLSGTEDPVLEAKEISISETKT